MIESQAILLDTCIVRNLFSKEKLLREKTEQFLDELRKSENKLYVSEYTSYELLRGIDSSKKSKAEEIIAGFDMVPTSKNRLDRATRLYTALHENPATKSSLASISDIDIFIGSLIFNDQKPLLLTADYNDFPSPFFDEVYKQDIQYKKAKGAQCCMYYYFLEANLVALF